MQTSPNWPLYRVAVNNTAYIIGRPMFTGPSLFGRGTRTYIAYQPDTDEVHVLKDSWRADHAEILPEHLVYARLRKHKVSNVLTCLAGEDVDQGAQRTEYHDLDGSGTLARIHYRIVFAEVCRPLTDFVSFKELAKLMADAMIGRPSRRVLLSASVKI